MLDHRRDVKLSVTESRGNHVDVFQAHGTGPWADHYRHPSAFAGGLIASPPIGRPFDGSDDERSRARMSAVDVLSWPFGKRKVGFGTADERQRWKFVSSRDTTL